jgi:hypothetical protein
MEVMVILPLRPPAPVLLLVILILIICVKVVQVHVGEWQVADRIIVVVVAMVPRFVEMVIAKQVMEKME